jgi:hypothetical protein
MSKMFVDGHLEHKCSFPKMVFAIFVGCRMPCQSYRGRSAGRVDATRGSKHRGLEHAREKRK